MSASSALRCRARELVSGDARPKVSVWGGPPCSIYEIGEGCGLESRRRVGRSIQAVGSASGVRRRRCSAEETARIVTQTFASGIILSEVASNHAIAAGLLLPWRHETSAKEHGAAAVDGLVPVHVAAPCPTTGMQSAVAEEPPHRARPATKKSGSIEIGSVVESGFVSTPMSMRTRWVACSTFWNADDPSTGRRRCVVDVWSYRHEEGSPGARSFGSGDVEARSFRRQFACFRGPVR